MNRILPEDVRTQLDSRIAEVEKRTNTQIVLALVRRSDSYAEIPWKAFALGASVTGLLVFIIDLSLSDWYSEITALIIIAGILGGGSLFALLTLLMPGFARQFLSASRAEVEVKQYAESLFLTRELFATSKRTGILMLVSLFERHVYIHPDKGLNDLMQENTLQKIITVMKPLLRRRKIGHALETGLDQISGILGTRTQGTGKNELSDEIIEEKGA